jgi:lactate dehydrogenase-like 2-hydroxyacid dehydrogenase
MKPRIMLFEPMLDAIERRLDADYEVCRMTTPQGRDLAEREPDTIRAVATGGGTGLSRDWMDRLTRLGIIAVNGVGTDKVDLVEAQRRGIHVSTTQGVLTDDVADLGMALILGVLRRLGDGERLVRSGDWARGRKLPLGTSLKGRRLGILGLGQIGRALGRRGEAFGMSVSYWNRSPVADAPSWSSFATPTDLASDSDILAVCIAATTATEAMVNAALLDALGPRGVLVNVARGSVIDEPALIESLRSGAIAGAGLDVFLGEPAIDPAFAELKNTFLMPHQGSATMETRIAMGEMVLANLEAYFAGEQPPHCVMQEKRAAAS